MSVLNTIAVAARTGSDAQELLNAYIGTGPNMVLNHTVAVPEQKLAGATAGGKSVEPQK